ncbi:phage protease [Mesorhizobium sp.]|uniref:phage protease n=1 Tax=Mesorhizobium sp. TaxID=1871066 RepID=UPI0025BEE7F9|nr:phage protease [Mesorhizobium sp.]
MHNALAALLSAALVASHSTALTAADAEGKWVQLIPAGSFSGRDGRGPYSSGDKDAMQAVVDRSAALLGKTEAVIDYDHQSVFGAVEGVGGTAPAAGWIKEMSVRDDGVWGRVEWTPKASEAIKAGEYKYLSPVFMHDKAGKVLAIRMAGLTNTPNLDLIAVAASSLFSATNPTGDSMDKILVALGLAKGTNEDGVIAAINALLTSSTAIAKAAGLTEAAKPADILTAVNSMATDRKKLAEAAGLNGDAKADDIVTAVQTAVKGVDPSKHVPIEQVATLQGDLKKLQDEVLAGKVKVAVSSAMSLGKVPPSLEVWAVDFATKDLAGFEAYTEKAPALTKSQLEEPKRKEAGEADLGDPVALAAAATAYQKQRADVGQTIDFATAVNAVKEGKK